MRFGHIDHRVASEESKRHEFESTLDDILNRKVLWSGGMVKPKGVPDHKIFHGLQTVQRKKSHSPSSISQARCDTK